jgi:spore maturation protein CgeB
MKILIIGRDVKYNAEFFYKKAFSKLGHEVILVDEYEGIKRVTLTRLLHTRTRILNFTLKKIPINKNIINEIREIDPDRILIFKGELISSENIKKISESYNLNLFYPDTFKFKSILENRLEYFKTLFTAANNIEFYKDLGAKRIITVPWACDPDFHRKLDMDKKYDVSFIGTAYPERRRIIRKLGKIDVFGDYWYGFAKRSHNPVYGEEYVKVINESIINLNLQAKISVAADAPTMRTFEIAGCGGFQISDYMPSLKRYFPMMPTFTEVEGLRDQIQYYLDNEEDRDEIALKCMEICRDSFKYTDSAKTILSQMR